jgi:osmoprotectant transport system permease protein
MMATGPNSFIWWDWVGRHTHEIWLATLEHLRLTLLAVVIGLAISLLLAALSLRWRPLYTPLAGFAGLLYTIPSLALFALLLPLTGFNTLTAEIGLVSYTLAIFLRNIVEGVDGVAPAVTDAADGMGYGLVRRLVTVELPLALPAIIAGLRIATVSTVALTTVGAIVSYGGLGDLLLEAVNTQFKAQALAASVLCVLLALAFDIVLVGVQWLLTPWTHGRGRVST